MVVGEKIQKEINHDDYRGGTGRIHGFDMYSVLFWGLRLRRRVQFENILCGFHRRHHPKSTRWSKSRTSRSTSRTSDQPWGNEFVHLHRYDAVFSPNPLNYRKTFLVVYYETLLVSKKGLLLPKVSVYFPIYWDFFCVAPEMIFFGETIEGSANFSTLFLLFFYFFSTFLYFFSTK